MIRTNSEKKEQTMSGLLVNTFIAGLVVWLFMAWILP